MDGVTMITQCPILPFTSFRYDFKPDSNGTYFYHAHSIYQQADGLHGALIVNSPSDDQNLQNTFILSAKSDHISPLSSSQSAPIALTINGKINNAEWTVQRQQLSSAVNKRQYFLPACIFHRRAAINHKTLKSR
ncbi:uncharacterized protein LOC130665190 [Microplitis mediator]|uniref:uncharacterized protein LOC130665190 n=1 Tax=Microplitis mediator TaxID=375433 RepID=UPI0025551ADF|nr:uncharacterized protein LOC130665190 [Microplitis mediator]